MSPEKALEGYALYSRYKEIQKSLEENLGCYKKFFQSIMNVLDPDNKYCKWQNKNIKIEHYIQNRFGTEELIKISILQDNHQSENG